MSVFDKQVSAEDMTGGGNKSGNFPVLDEGWYPLTAKKAEGKISKPGQAKLSIQWGVCEEDGNPDSVTKFSVFHDILLPLFEDEAAFKEDLGSKKGLDGDDLEAEFVIRLERDESNAAKAAFAIFGYDHFVAVPRWDSEAKCRRLPDGTVVSDAEAKELYKQRNAEAINALLAVGRGEEDLSRYMVAGRLEINEYNGKRNNRVKWINAKLPADASYSAVPKK
jgi:hypothetical protein